MASRSDRQLFGRRQRSQATISSRVTITAVNIEQMMPMTSVTREALTGPEPNR